MQRLSLSTVLDVWEGKRIGFWWSHWRTLSRVEAEIAQREQAVAVTISYMRVGNGMVPLAIHYEQLCTTRC